MLEAVVLAAAHRCTYGRREPQVVRITTASRVSGARIGRLLRRPTVPASPTLGLTHLFDAMLTASQESTDSLDFRSRALKPLEVHTSSNVHGIDQWIP